MVQRTSSGLLMQPGRRRSGTIEYAAMAVLIAAGIGMMARSVMPDLRVEVSGFTAPILLMLTTR